MKIPTAFGKLSSSTVLMPLHGNSTIKTNICKGRCFKEIVGYLPSRFDAQINT